MSNIVILSAIIVHKTPLMTHAFSSLLKGAIWLWLTFLGASMSVQTHPWNTQIHSWPCVGATRTPLPLFENIFNYDLNDFGIYVANKWKDAVKQCLKMTERSFDSLGKDGRWFLPFLVVRLQSKVPNHAANVIKRYRIMTILQASPYGAHKRNISHQSSYELLRHPQSFIKPLTPSDV